MDSSTDPVELLERAIGYTRSTLVTIRPDQLEAPTPCAGWRLADLLDHMADALDALTEASSGLVDIAVLPVRGNPVHVLKEKACALLGAWSAPAAETVRLGDAALDAGVLLGAGALEITLHGWDVGQATGARIEIPEELAAALLGIAHALVAEEDRGVRFAAPVDVPPGASHREQLLAFSGRRVPVTNSP